MTPNDAVVADTSINSWVNFSPNAFCTTTSSPLQEIYQLSASQREGSIKGISHPMQPPPTGIVVA